MAIAATCRSHLASNRVKRTRGLADTRFEPSYRVKANFPNGPRNRQLGPGDDQPLISARARVGCGPSGLVQQIAQHALAAGDDWRVGHHARV